MITLAAPWTGTPIFQRNALDQVFPVVTGTYSSPTATSILGQVVRQDGSVMIDWFTLATGLSGGTFTGTLGFPAQPGWLKLNLRTNEDGTIYSSNWFGTGDVWIVGGQSNAERLFGASVTGVGTRLHPAAYYTPDAAEGIALGNGGGGWGTNLSAAACLLSNAVSAQTGFACGFLFLARGGFPLCKDSATGEQYLLSQSGSLANFPNEQFLTKSSASIAESGSGGYRGLIFIGNETDAVATPDDTLYLGLNQWLLALSGRATRPVIMTLVGRFGTRDTARIRAVETRWVENTPGGLCGPTRDCLALESDGLDVHLTPASLMIFAASLAQTMVLTYLPTS